MRKEDSKKKLNLPPLRKYINTESDNYKSKQVIESSLGIQRVKSQQLNLSSDICSKGKEYINEQFEIDQLKDKATMLTDEITKFKQDKSIFENNLLSQFEQKYAILRSNQEKLLKSANEEIDKLTSKLEKTKKKKKELKVQVTHLQAEIERYSKLNTSIQENYDSKLKETNDGFLLKIKTTTKLFENFLQNNKELLTTDLYSLYHELKRKFEMKIKECLEVKSSNNTLKSENKLYRLSMDTNKDILNKCAQKQIEHKKKIKLLQFETEEKSRLINQMKTEYKEQFVELENKFNLLLNENDDEVKLLQLALKTTTKELEEIKATSKLIIDQRSQIELFFIEALKDVKKEITAERKLNEKDKRQSGINTTSNNNICSKENDSIYLKTIQKVDIKEIGPENKDKLLRMLLTKLNQNQPNKHYAKLRQLTFIKS